MGDWQVKEIMLDILINRNGQTVKYWNKVSYFLQWVDDLMWFKRPEEMWSEVCCLCYQIVSDISFLFTLFCHANIKCCKAFSMLMYSRPTCQSPTPTVHHSRHNQHLFQTRKHSYLHSSSIYVSLCQCWTWLWLGLGGMIKIHGMTNFISR